MRVLAVIYAVPGVGWAVATLGLVMAPASFALGRVFVLPYLIVMAPLRVLGAVVVWRDLRR